MRLLSICNACQRQYDSSDLNPGSRFRCHCGEVVKVEAPTGLDASVVRCSSCGAPREDAASACPHCSSDFTLHERDLHTVCPHCAARISDQAKFCHHCGHGISTTAVAGEEVNLACPACDEKPPLRSRQLGTFKVTAAECGRCAGLWLGVDCFQLLISKAGEAAKVDCDFTQMRAKMSSPPTGREEQHSTGDRKWKYRHCPQCDKMMQRRHYAKRSGVIIDSCRDHGIWFDADELHQVIQHVRSQGLADDGLPSSRKVTVSTRREVDVVDKDGARTIYDSGRVPGRGSILVDFAEIFGDTAGNSLLDGLISNLFDL